MRVSYCLREIVDVDPFDVGLALVKVEAFDVVLKSAVHVNGLRMDSRERAGKIHLADDLRRIGLVNDDKVVGGD